MTKILLPSLSRVRTALYDDWSLQVRQRDGWKCLLCGSTEDLTPHHWYVCDHHAHAARYCVDNGATLCYACHIRKVHQRADWVTVNDVMQAVLGRTPDIDEVELERLVSTDLTTSVLREMWNNMRDRNTVNFDSYRSEYILKNDGKMFVTVEHPYPIAVVDNVVTTCLNDRHEVLVVTKMPTGFYRYTVKELVA